MKLAIRNTALALFIIALALLPLFLRSRSESLHYLEKARVFAQNKQIEQAIENYRKSISWRSPGDPSPVAAGQELMALSELSALPINQKLMALEELRRGLYASRSWWWDMEGAWLGPSIGEVQRKVELLAPPPADYVREADPPSVDFFFQGIAQCFFWSWFACTLSAIWRGFDKDGRLLPSRLAPRLAISAGCFIAWLIALSQA